MVINKALHKKVKSSVIPGLRSFTTLLWTTSGYSDLLLLSLLIVPLLPAIQFVTQPHIHPLRRRSLIQKYTQSPKKAQLQKIFYCSCFGLTFSEYSLLCLAINCPAKFLFGFLFFIYLKKNLYDISCLLQVGPHSNLPSYAFIFNWPVLILFSIFLFSM